MVCALAVKALRWNATSHVDNRADHLEHAGRRLCAEVESPPTDFWIGRVRAQEEIGLDGVMDKEV